MSKTSFTLILVTPICISVPQDTERTITATANWCIIKESEKAILKAVTYCQYVNRGCCLAVPPRFSGSPCIALDRKVSSKREATAFLFTQVFLTVIPHVCIFLYPCHITEYF